MRIFRNSGEIVPFGPLSKARTVFQSVRWFSKPKEGRPFLDYFGFIEEVVPKRADILSRRMSTTVSTFGPMLYALDQGEQTRITDGSEGPPRVEGHHVVQRWYDASLDQTLWVYRPLEPISQEKLQKLEETWAAR